MTLKYATTTQLAEILGIKNEIPSWDVGSTPSNEEVGTGDDSETIFYLDHKNILSNSYVLYHGATAATTDTLTEVTHYTLDKTTGKITLTSAGVTLVSTNKIFAEYSYISNSMTDDFLNTTLLRAEKEVNDSTNTIFNDGTVTNPTFPYILREVHPSQFMIKPQYFTGERPLIDIVSSLPGDITDSATSILLTTGDGSKYPSSGFVYIDSEIIAYTGITTDTLTGCTRGQLDSVAAAHVTGDSVHTTIVEISNSIQGSVPVWEFLSWDNKFVANALGKIYIYEDALISNIDQDVANRVRISYYNGFDTIPLDITRLTLLYAKRQLMQDTISKSITAGRDEFNPEMFNADMSEINMIVNAYRQNGMGNT